MKHTPEEKNHSIEFYKKNHDSFKRTCKRVVITCAVLCLAIELLSNNTPITKTIFSVSIGSVSIAMYSVFVWMSKRKLCIELRELEPEEDEWIEITYLPNPINNPHEKSCYIGTKGIVKDKGIDGSFMLKMHESGWLIVHGADYEFRYLTKEEIKQLTNA